MPCLWKQVKQIFNLWRKFLKDQFSIDSKDAKYSSSQTSQGAFTNNPNKEDNGAGIQEKLAH
jgi:hypothetical protein